MVAVKYSEERVFTIPLRKAFLKERTKRARRSIDLIRAFLERHMKGEVKIGASINESVWARGMQKPPRRVRVHAIKEKIEDVDVVFSELVNIEIKKPTADEIKKKQDKEKEKEKKKKEERKERKQTVRDREMGVKPEAGEKEETVKREDEKKEESKKEEQIKETKVETKDNIEEVKK